MLICFTSVFIQPLTRRAERKYELTTGSVKGHLEGEESTGNQSSQKQKVLGRVNVAPQVPT